jgi:hypothetical protein
MRALQSRLIQELANLNAQRTRAHYDVIARELDIDAVDSFCIANGLGRGENLLWRLAALAPDVIELDALHPYLSWVHTNLELTLERLESDVELLFKFVGPVLEQIGES